jgi:MFS family permease
MTLDQWALITAFKFLAIAVPGIIAGFSMDTLGRKRFLILGFLLFIPGMVLFVNADFNMLLLSFFLFGLGNLLQLNIYNVLMGDLVPRNLRGTVTGCIQFFMFIVQAILQILIGAIYVYVSPELPFLMFAATMIPLSIFVYFKVHEPTVREA